VDGVYSKQKYNASFVGFFPSRKPRFAIIVVIDSPSTGPYYGGLVAAPVFKRIAQALVPLMGVPRTIGAPATVLVTHRDETPALPAKLEILAAPASGPSDVVPDLRGLSAREALRRMVRLGISPRLSGDGFVVSQRPEAGTPLSEASGCDLRLARVLPDPPADETEERP
jgi:cell division protein FtsI (penicillin-binding protein 3)